MKDDIEIIRHALQAAKAVAHIHRRGGLQELRSELLDATRALDRIEWEISPAQLEFPHHNSDSANHKRGT